MVNNILFVVIVEKGDVVAKPEMGKRRVSVHVKFQDLYVSRNQNECCRNQVIFVNGQTHKSKQCLRYMM